MSSRPIHIVLSLLPLVCLMGPSESTAQRKTEKPGKQQAAPTNSAIPATPTSPTPTPTPPPDKLLTEIKETIDGFSYGEESLPYERTFNFQLSDECKTGCTDCTLTWNFERYGATPPPGTARTVERFSVAVKLSAINPERIYVDKTQVEFGTNNGRTITLYTGNPVVRTDRVDAWQISIRREDGAERVASLLKRVVSESCPKR